MTPTSSTCSATSRPALKPLKLVVNAGNGGAGLVIDRLEVALPFEFVKLQHEPDGTFPHGVPNPLLPEHRALTAEAVVPAQGGLRHRLGRRLRPLLPVRRDRPLHRGLLHRRPAGRGVPAEASGREDRARPAPDLEHHRHRGRSGGGVPVMSKTGHAFIKERMRLEDAVYGGEMSAHHYFRDFAYCDSGMIPWLLVAELVSRAGRPLSALVEERMAAFPASGEINRSLDDPPAVLARSRRITATGRIVWRWTTRMACRWSSMPKTDEWRFNLRASNTEPLVRLNVESRGDAALMEAKTAEPDQGPQQRIDGHEGNDGDPERLDQRHAPLGQRLHKLRHSVPPATRRFQFQCSQGADGAALLLSPYVSARGSAVLTLFPRIIRGICACIALAGASACGGGGADDAGGAPAPAPAPALSTAPADCVGGMAGDFPCSGIRLHRRVPLGELGGVAGNDIWGWTDSLTGAEYALMGMTTGTAFVNVSDPENPIVLGRLPTQTVASVWRDIKVYGDHAYIVADRAGRHGLQVFDLTRLRNAIPPQLFTPDLVYGDFGSAHNLAINEATGFAYVVGSGDAVGAHLPAARVRPPGMVHGRPPLFPAGR
jgi:hypothetical protein